MGRIGEKTAVLVEMPLVCMLQMSSSEDGAGGRRAPPSGVSQLIIAT